MNYVICSGLEIPINEDDLLNINDIIPESCFGVFVTARRTHEFYRPYGREIKTHGCQGYWNKDFSNLSKDEIVSKIQKVSIETTSNKDRRKYRFKNPIQQDMGASYEINFMLNPIVPVDTKTGKMESGEMFNNTDYGLIFVGNDNKQATYLPRTWINKCWGEIKTMLRNKATSQTQGKFYAYETISYKEGIERIFNQNYLNFLIKGFSEYIENNYENVIPYDRSPSGENITRIDKGVRNLLSMNVALKTENLTNEETINKINNNVNYYCQMFDVDAESMRQASAFLSLTIKNLNKGSTDKICSYLHDNLSKMEPRFELGEVMVALSECYPKMDVLLSTERKMYRSIPATIRSIDDIFQFNWHSQYLYSLHKTHNELCGDHARMLLNRTIDVIGKFKDPEINYLVVSLETLAHLFPLMSYEKDKKRLYDYLLRMFCEVNKKHKEGLYCLKNNSARIDLTAHAVNSYITMIKEKMTK